jgi:hypothetical protein
MIDILLCVLHAIWISVYVESTHFSHIYLFNHIFYLNSDCSDTISSYMYMYIDEIKPIFKLKTQQRGT